MELLSIEAVQKMRQGKVLVLTNGVFDILHAGHVDYLEKARSFGDLLVVGMNTDESVRALGKGPERPINTLEDRARVLSALRCVDGVVAFGERTASALVELLKPDVYVKGGDYTIDTLPEGQIVLGYGGRVEIIPLLPGRSTTEVVKKMRQG